MATSCDKGTAMVLSCQRISTSMSAEQASSGAIPWTSTVSPFPSGETTLGFPFARSVQADSRYHPTNRDTRRRATDTSTPQSFQIAEMRAKSMG
jgi:hypothetical protein